MTLMDVTFPYKAPPGERQMIALNCACEIYGMRKLSIHEAEQTVTVEYDISRLAEDDVAALLRGAGLDIQEPLKP
jgi:hypothetical protein